MSNLGNCGDFLPGYEPRRIVTSNTLPPVYTPNPNLEVTIFNVPECPPPSEPGEPSQPGLPGPGVPGDGTPGVPPTPPSTGGPPGPSAPAPPGPSTGAPPGPSAPVPPGPSTGGPPGPSAPPPGGPRFRPRDVTTGGPRGPSAPAPTGPAGRGNPRRALRRRGPTTGVPAGPSAPIPGGGVGGGSEPNGGTQPGPTEPPNVTAPKFTRDLLTTESYPGSVVVGNNTRNEQTVSNSLNIDTPQSSVLEGSTNATTVLNQVENSLPFREVVTINVDNPAFTTYTSSSTQICNSLFNKVYNFFNVSPEQQTNFVQHSNIETNFLFSNLVAEEVKYFLDRQNSNSSWNETMVNNLTIQKVAASINPNIINYFNNIHDAGNVQINKNKFYSAVKRHLLEGTVQEFNSLFFQETYQKQIQDPFIVYNQTGENNTTINLAFAIFEQNAINPNYNNSLLTQEQTNDYLRMRFLPEDLECYIPIVEIDGTNSQLYVKNSGIPTEQLNVGFVPNPASGVSLPFGQGAGYYFSTLAYGTSAIYPLPTQNLLSAAHYVENRDRYNILNLLNADPSIYLTVDSASGVHEFSSTYNPSADVNVMYFALSSDSVGDILNTNSVITTTSASYYLMQDSDAINHSRDYGFNTIKVNVDYRDPILNYSKDTSTITFKCNDFNLRSLGRTTTLQSNKLMVRNIPQALILSPGCGSRHNPFNSTSEIDQYSNDIVTRTLKISPSINTSNQEIQRPPLEQDRIYFELSSNYFGAYEQQFNQDFHGFLYTYNPTSVAFQNSYYLNGEYTSTQPASSLRENSPEAKFMNLVDRLTSVAKTVDEDFTNSGLPDLFGFLTWFDIYRRLSSKDIGELKYSKINQFLNKLPDGYSNGIPVKAVLNENNAIVTGIPESYESLISPPAPIIISESDRFEHYIRYYNG